MKSGQINVFVVIGILLVAGVVLVFLFKTGKIPSPVGSFEENPQKYIEGCISPKIKQAVDLLNKQGGQINPELFKTFKFSEDKESQNISYLCYTSKNYLPCVNREPVLIAHLENEIYNYISKDISNCFDDWKKAAEKQGYSVDTGILNYSVSLNPEQIVLDINMEISLNKKEESLRFDKFRVVIKDKIYDLAIVAQEISSQEAEYCNFESQGFMIFYPKFNIDKFRTSDLNIIYTIQDRKSQEKMRFAIRGCVIPAGM